MRPLERIDDITFLINEIWQFDPDMRFMQLIYVLQSKFSHHNKDEGTVKESDTHDSGRIGYDLFHLEDTKFEAFLREHLDKLKNLQSEQVAAGNPLPVE